VPDGGCQSADREALPTRALNHQHGEPQGVQAPPRAPPVTRSAAESRTTQLPPVQHPSCATPIRPVRTCSTYNFKGALRAPGRGLAAVHAKAPHDGGADYVAARHLPVAGWPLGNRDAPGVGCLPLALRATSAPARTHPTADHSGSAPQRQQWRAVLQNGPSLRRSALKPRKIAGKGAPEGASLAGASADPGPRVLTRIQ
jgi:hypothetical protein